MTSMYEFMYNSHIPVQREVATI